jgi:hypothetical protein
VTYADNNEKAADFGKGEAKQHWGKAYTEDKAIERLEAEVKRLNEQMLKVHAEQVRHTLNRDRHRAMEKDILTAVELLERPRMSFDMTDAGYKTKMGQQRKKIAEYTGTTTFL